MAVHLQRRLGGHLLWPRCVTKNKQTGWNVSTVNKSLNMAPLFWFHSVMFPPICLQIWTTAPITNLVPTGPRAWTQVTAATPAPAYQASLGSTVTQRSGSVTASPVTTEATAWWVRKSLSLLSHNTGFPVFVFASVYLLVQEDAIDCQVSRWPSSQTVYCK